MDAVNRFVINKAKSQAQKMVPIIVQSIQDLQTPLLDENKLLKSKSFLGEDVRSHFKKTVRQLLSTCYKDLVLNDSNENGKSRQISKTANCFVLYQFLQKLKSTTSVTIAQKNIMERCSRISESFFQIQRAEYKKIKAQNEACRIGKKIEDLEYSDYTCVQDDDLDELSSIYQKQALSEQEVFLQKKNIGIEIERLLDDLFKLEITKDDKPWSELKDFALSIQNGNLYPHSSEKELRTQFIEDLVTFEQIRFDVENDPAFKERLALLPFEILMSPTTAVQFLLSLGQVGKTLLNSMNTEFGYFDSRNIFAKGMYTVYSMLGYSSEDFQIYDKEVENKFRGENPLVVRLRQMVASLEDKKERDQFTYYLFGDLSQKGKKRGFLLTCQSEMVWGFRMSQPEAYIGKKLTKLFHLKIPIHRKSIKTRSQLLNWQAALQWATKHENNANNTPLFANELEKSSKNSRHILENRIKKTQNLIGRAKQLFPECAEVLEQVELPKIPFTAGIDHIHSGVSDHGKIIPQRLYLEKIEGRIFEIIEPYINKKNDVPIDFKSQWKHFEKSYCSTQNRILAQASQNALAIVGVHALKGNGSLEILQSQILARTEKIKLAVTEFKRKLNDDCSLKAIIETLSHSGIFKYILSAQNQGKKFKVDIRRFLSHSAEMISKISALNSLSKEYIEKILTEDEYKCIRELLVIKFEIQKEVEGKITQETISVNLEHNSLKSLQKDNRFLISSENSSQIENLRLELDENSHLALLDSHATSLVKRVDKIIVKIKGLLFQTEMDNEKITFSFHQLIDRFLGKILTADQISQYEKDRKLTAEKLNQYQKQKDVLKKLKKQSLNSSESLPLLLEIENLEKLLRETKKELFSNYSDFLKNIFNSVEELSTAPEQSYTTFSKNKLESLNISPSFEKISENISILDGLLFKLNAYRPQHESLAYDLTSKLLLTLKNEVVRSQSFFQDPHRQKIIQDFIDDIIEHQIRICRNMDAQSRKLLKLLKKMKMDPLDAPRMGGANTKENLDQSLLLAPMKLISFTLEQLQSKQKKIFQELLKTHQAYLDNLADQQRRLLTARFLGESVTQEFIEAHLDYGCTLVRSSELPHLGKDVGVYYYRDPGIWTCFLAPNPESLDDEEYGMQLATLLSLMASRRPLEFDPRNPEDELKKEQILSCFEELTEIYTAHNYTTVRIEWGELKVKLINFYQHAEVKEGTVVREPLVQLLSKLDFLSKTLKDKRNLSANAQLVVDLMSSVASELKLLYTASDFEITKAEKSVLNEILVLLKYQDSVAFKNILAEHFSRENYQEAQERFRKVVGKIFSISAEKERDANLKDVKMLGNVGGLGAKNVFDQIQIKKMYGFLTDTMETIDKYIKESEICFNGLSLIEPNLKKRIFKWKKEQIEFTELDREIRSIQSIFDIISIFPNVSLYSVTMKVFLTKHHLLHDFLVIEKCLAELEEKLDITNEQKNKFLVHLKRICFRLSKVIQKLGLNCYTPMERTIIWFLVQGLNAILPKRYQLMGKNSVWQEVKNSDIEWQWSDLFQTSLTKISEKVISHYAPDANVVRSETSHYVKGYRESFLSLRRKIEEVSLESLSQDLFTLSAKVKEASLQFEKFNSHLTLINSYYFASQEILEIHEKNSIYHSALMANEDYVYCLNNAYNKDKDVNLFSFPLESMASFVKTYDKFMAEQVKWDNVTLSLKSFLALDEEGKKEVCENLNIHFGLTYREVKPSDICHLLVEKKQIICVKASLSILSFMMSLDEQQNLTFHFDGQRCEENVNIFQYALSKEEEFTRRNSFHENPNRDHFLKNLHDIMQNLLLDSQKMLGWLQELNAEELPLLPSGFHLPEDFCFYDDAEYANLTLDKRKQVHDQSRLLKTELDEKNSWIDKNYLYLQERLYSFLFDKDQLNISSIKRLLVMRNIFLSMRAMDEISSGGYVAVFSAYGLNVSLCLSPFFDVHENVEFLQDFLASLETQKKNFFSKVFDLKNKISRIEEKFYSDSLFFQKFLSDDQSLHLYWKDEFLGDIELQSETILESSNLKEQCEQLVNGRVTAFVYDWRGDLQALFSFERNKNSINTRIYAKEMNKIPHLKATLTSFLSGVELNFNESVKRCVKPEVTGYFSTKSLSETEWSAEELLIQAKMEHLKRSTLIYAFDLPYYFLEENGTLSEKPLKILLVDLLRDHIKFIAEKEGLLGKELEKRSNQLKQCKNKLQEIYNRRALAIKNETQNKTLSPRSLEEQNELEQFTAEFNSAWEQFNSFKQDCAQGVAKKWLNLEAQNSPLQSEFHSLDDGVSESSSGNSEPETVEPSVEGVKTRLIANSPPPKMA